MERADQIERRRLFQDPLLLIIIIAVIAVLLMFIAYPLFCILKGSFMDGSGQLTLSSYTAIFKDSGFKTAFWNTMRLGLVVGLTSTIVGFLFAYTKQCVKSPFKKLFGVIEILPIISPPFVLAFSAITLLGRRGLITYGLLGIKNFNIYGYTGLVIVQTLVFFPIAAMTLDGLLENFDVSMEEAARNMGASRFRVFFTVQIPMLASGLANVFLLSFIESVTDFSNPMILGGGYKTLASQIYIQAIALSHLHSGGVLKQQDFH